MLIEAVSIIASNWKLFKYSFSAKHKQKNMTHSCNTILLNIKKKQTIDTYTNMT